MEPQALKIVRKRKRSVKSKIAARAKQQEKLAALDARKVAALEYVGELLEEAVALLKAEGFKATKGLFAPTGMVSNVATTATIPPTVQHPCSWCGREGVMQNEDKSAWVCQAHAQYEVGGAIQNKQGRSLFEEMNGKPVAAARNRPKPAPTITAVVSGAVVPVELPPSPKLLIHPSAAETAGTRPEPHIIDPLKGVVNGVAGNAVVNSEETGDNP